MYSEILERIKTRDEQDRLIQTLDKLLAGMYANLDYEDVLHQLPASIYQIILQKTEGKKSDEKKEFISGLKKEIDSMKSVRLTLAFEPDNYTFSIIYRWFLDNVGNHIVLDITVNPGIIGGAEVSLDGKYYDGTLITKVLNIYKKNTKGNKRQQ